MAVDIERGRKLAANVTPGPWCIDTLRDGHEVSYAIADAERWRGYTNNISLGEDLETAEFIVWCRNNIDAILTELEAIVPPRSEHRWANLVFDGRLEEMLTRWRAERMSYERMAALINADLAERAAAVGDEPIVLAPAAIQRWVHNEYEIE